MNLFLNQERQNSSISPTTNIDVGQILIAILDGLTVGFSMEMRFVLHQEKCAVHLDVFISNI